MNTKQSHTQTLIAGEYGLMLEDDKAGFLKMPKENARLIVRAVNMHEELVEMLKRLHVHSLCKSDCELSNLIAKAEGK